MERSSYGISYLKDHSYEETPTPKETCYILLPIDFFYTISGTLPYEINFVTNDLLMRPLQKRLKDVDMVSDVQLKIILGEMGGRRGMS